jgi:hypothetical protein
MMGAMVSVKVTGAAAWRVAVAKEKRPSAMLLVVDISLPVITRL